MNYILFIVSIMFFMNIDWQYKQNISDYEDTIFVKCKNDSILLGHWTFNEDIAYLDIKKRKTLCCVIHNQIYIYVLIKKVNDSCYNVFYDSIADVGSGGAHLNWDYFSKTVPIARLELINSKKIHFYWLGFWDLINNIRVLRNTDFNSTVTILNKE